MPVGGVEGLVANSVCPSCSLRQGLCRCSATISDVRIIGNDGIPILYASLTSEGKLRLQFEYFARDDNEGDYEFNHTIEPEEFPKIAQRFGLDPATPILENLKQISAIRKGEKLKDLLTDKEIPNEFWSWLS
jgi:hypothetical protein